MSDLGPQRWKWILAAIIAVDVLVVAGIAGYFAASKSPAAVISAALTVSPTATATATPTPWPGPGKRLTATPTLPPTVIPTDILAEGGFPVGFTPTPRPTRDPVKITLPKLYFTGRNYVDVPVVNQVYYPEPFFPAGTNNACGPVALFAGLRGLGVDVDYGRLRNIAVSYGFNAEGISKSGMVGAVAALNQELGGPVQIEHGSRYGLRSLIKQQRQGGVVVVLVYVRRVNGRYVVSPDRAGAIGHFLLVERISLKSRKVYVAGSTLGMEQVPLLDFLRSWSGNPQASLPAYSSWKSYLDKEKENNWALIIKRSK